MPHFPCNNRGISIVEVLIAVVITAIGIIAVLSMQPMSWQTATKSDLLGRSASILHKELEEIELIIMNINNAIPSNSNKNVFASGETTSQGTGDTAYTVQTTITNNGDGSWTVRVDVTDPDNKTVSESIIVTRQEGFRF
jgi:Tfp pilus assembly protein PilV